MEVNESCAGVLSCDLLDRRGDACLVQLSCPSGRLHQGAAGEQPAPVTAGLCSLNTPPRCKLIVEVTWS